MIQAILKKWVDQPPSPASVDIYCTELLLVIGELMVKDVQKDLEENTSMCSVCYVVTSKKALQSHIIKRMLEAAAC